MATGQVQGQASLHDTSQKRPMLSYHGCGTEHILIKVYLALKMCPLADSPPGKVLLKAHSQKDPTFSEAISDLKSDSLNEESTLSKSNPNVANSNVTDLTPKVDRTF